MNIGGPDVADWEMQYSLWPAQRVLHCQILAIRKYDLCCGPHSGPCIAGSWRFGKPLFICGPHSGPYIAMMLAVFFLRLGMERFL
jgi:hypothetical protein